MLVIVLASQKGGVGKTTIAGHLAVEAERQGVGPVAVLDTDPQAGLAAWWNAREAQTPAFAQLLAGGLRSTLASLEARGCGLAVIDTPPALTASIRETVALASLVLVPVQPSPHDLRAVGGTVELVRKARRPLVFVLNRTRAGTRLTADAAVALSQHGTVAPTFLVDRQDYRASMIDGRTAGEADATSKSAVEIADLWRYVALRIEGETDARTPSAAA
jgi:chromosome partitioning protein